MNTPTDRSLILHALQNVCPLMYVGQLVELVLAHDPRTPPVGKRGGEEFGKLRKRRRTSVVRLLKDLRKLGHLSTYEKLTGYELKHIVSSGPLLCVPPQSAIQDIAAEQERLWAAAKNAIGARCTRVCYFQPKAISRPALANPFFREVIEYAESHPRDGRGDITIAALRLGSLYVSQLVHDKHEATSFHITDRRSSELEGLEPLAVIARRHGATDLYAAHSFMMDNLGELSKRQARSDRWLEIWM